MVELNKKIKDVIKEIIYLIMLILFSYLIWSKLGTNTWAPIAYAYNHQEDKLILNKSELDLDNNKTFIKIENNNNLSKNYIVYLSLKTKELDKINNSYITINTEETSLKDIDSFIKNSNVYYKIITGNINGREENSYFISLNTPLEYNINLKELK